MRDINMQGSTVKQQNMNISEQGDATQTNTFDVPDEHKAAVAETAGKVQAELRKPAPSVKSILSDLTELGWQNAPAFLAMAKAWFLK